MHPLLRSTHRIAAAMALAGAAAMTGCTGCGSNHNTTPAQDPGQDPAAIEAPLLQTPRHDPDRLNTFAADIAAGKRPDPVTTSQMLAVCHGQVQYLQQIADNLLANDDAADSHNVLTEIAADPTTHSLHTVYGALAAQEAALSPAQEQYRTALAGSMQHLRRTLRQIEQTQLHGRKTFQI